VRRRLAWLITGTLGLWAVTAYPAQRFGGDGALLYSTVAFALCLVPAAGTLVWSEWASQRSTEQQLLTILGGTGLRIVVVLGVGLTLYTLVPFFGRSSFWIWVVLFYLFTLTFEIVLLTGTRPATQRADERLTKPKVV
jgi:hypothetical protein